MKLTSRDQRRTFNAINDPLVRAIEQNRWLAWASIMDPLAHYEYVTPEGERDGLRMVELVFHKAMPWPDLIRWNGPGTARQTPKPLPMRRPSDEAE